MVKKSYVTNYAHHFIFAIYMFYLNIHSGPFPKYITVSNIRVDKIDNIDLAIIFFLICSSPFS